MDLKLPQRPFAKQTESLAREKWTLPARAAKG
jgi:hypothetical protein